MNIFQPISPKLREAMYGLAFSDTSEGLVYYPFGVMGAGYILGDREEAARKLNNKTIIVATVSAAVLGLSFVPLVKASPYFWLLALAVVALGWGVYWFSVSRLVNGLQKSATRLTISKISIAIAKAQSWKSLFIGFVIAVILVLMFLLLFFSNHPDALLVWGGLLFFGSGMLLETALLLIKWRHRSSN